ncbi:hypothetical protein AGR7B_Lc100035 [Agrobacterium deltaense RV3]|nr:hypothetical protein AGR7B_Lc100035 [Agrobacterium deltaense RV3]
MIVNKRD